MTRITCTDALAQALAAVAAAGAGVLLLPVETRGMDLEARAALQDATVLHEITRNGQNVGRFAVLPAGARRIYLDAPMRAGARCYVGETHYAHYRLGIRQYRAAGHQKPDGVRWRPGLQMPDWAARTTFRVVSRRAVQLQELTAEHAARAGLPAGCTLDQLHDAWTTWHGWRWDPRGWAWLIEVASLGAVRQVTAEQRHLLEDLEQQVERHRASNGGQRTAYPMQLCSQLVAVLEAAVPVALVSQRVGLPGNSIRQIALRHGLRGRRGVYRRVV